MSRDDQTDEHLLSMAHGDAGLARLLHESLHRLNDGVAGTGLQEMAREVLAGRVDLRQVAVTDVYATTIDQQVQRFRARYNELDPDER